MGCPGFELLHDTVYAKADVLFRWMNPQSIHYGNNKKREWVIPSTTIHTHTRARILHLLVQGLDNLIVLWLDTLRRPVNVLNMTHPIFGIHHLLTIHSSG